MTIGEHGGPTSGSSSGDAKPPRLARRARGCLCLDDFEAAAKRFLPRPLFGYVSGGLETDAAMRDNRAVFNELRFLPRVLRDVSGRSAETKLFGRNYAAPFGIAPMGISALTGYRGDLALACAAASAGVPMIMSGSSLIAMEDVARAAPGSWFQAYLPAETERVAALVDRTARAGFETLVVTVDSSVVPNRENNLRNGFRTPLRPDLALVWQGVTHPAWSLDVFLRTLLRHGMPHFENNYAERGAPLVSSDAVRDFSGRERLDWTEIERVRARWPGRLVLKGVLHPDDVALARAVGADGVILSNHGGRQLDHAVSPMRVLRAARAACGDMALMIDSGFRRGTDVLKALALGADFVFISRSFNYASAIGGQPGVAHAIDLLKAEIRAAMGTLGLTSVSELTPDVLLVGRES